MQLIKSTPKKACENMALDCQLLQDMHRESEAILHLYEWSSDALTWGCFVKPEKFLSMEGLKRWGMDTAMRPTGGGIIFHNGDLAFSYLMPSTHKNFSSNPIENYAFVNERVGLAIERFCARRCAFVQNPEKKSLEIERFCMAHPTRYDVIIDGKKVAGAAQRKTRFGYLHQGSIFLGFLEDQFYRDLLLYDSTLDQMKAKSAPLLGTVWTKGDLKEARRALTKLLISVFETS